MTPPDVPTLDQIAQGIPDHRELYPARRSLGSALCHRPPDMPPTRLVWRDLDCDWLPEVACG